MKKHYWCFFLYHLLPSLATAFPVTPYIILEANIPTASDVSISQSSSDVNKYHMAARKNARPSSPPVELAVHQRNSAENEASGQSVHYYMEVPDSPPPSDESVSEEVPPPPPVCHGPGNPPDDYLVPQPSRDETGEEGAEWKTVPFYENTQLRNTDQETSAEPPRDEY
ncbi:hypothetical protein BaRGS_00038533 [Batillaria attramentaria]|uniref:Uncharacterized protein n=1 Tax=Batillaria attramentaria TaxID=370345 RepID=A0ABD0J6E9_9CAEN